jgi:peptide/nickel transport system substrate-binding protein
MYKDTSKLYLFFIVFAIFTLSNCKSEKNKNRKIFRWNFSAPISTLDPIHIKSQTDVWVNAQLFSTLFTFNDSLTFDLAKNVEILDSGKTYFISIRKDVYFHTFQGFNTSNNTRILNAYDVVYSLRRLINPRNAARGAWVLNSHVTDTNKIQVIDTFKLSITIDKPFSTFLNLLSLPQTSIVPREAVESKKYNFNEKPIGSGPFVFYNYKQGEYLTLVENENFHNSKTGNIKEVVISFNSNRQSELLSFFQKKIDLIIGFDASTKDMIVDNNGNFYPEIANDFIIRKNEFLNTEYLAFNLNDSLLRSNDGIYFRRAVAFAINKKNIVKYYRNGIGIPAEEGFVPNINYPKNEDRTKYQQFNLDSAQKNLSKIKNLNWYYLISKTIENYKIILIFYKIFYLSN